MNRSRSRSPRPHRPNYAARSRSRSPFYNNRGKNSSYGNKAYRGSYQPASRPDDRRRRDDFRRSDFSPPRSQPFMQRRGSPVNHQHASSHSSVGSRNFNDDHNRHDRSPEPYNESYRTNAAMSQRLTTEPVPKQSSIFVGPEGTRIDLNELKKITVDIRRSMSRNNASISHGPLRYAFKPEDFILIRRPGEGSRPIFDREELKSLSIEERVIKLAHDVPDRMDVELSPVQRSRDSYSGPSGFQQQQDARSMDGDSEGDLRFRLLEKKTNDEIKDRMSTDPNFVPQGRYYYEHDNRDKYNNRGRGFAFRGNSRGNFHHQHQNNQQQQQNNPSYRGNYRGNGGGQFRESHRGSYRGRLRSPDWQHDLYDAVAVDDGKPSSTTPM